MSEYARRRASGRCDLCGQKAPFDKKDGTPYLEAHHVVWLSCGGEDTIDKIVVLCPNCHRKVHILNDSSDKNKMIKRLLSYHEMLNDLN